MNSKQTLKGLLLGLAAIALGVTSCNKADDKKSDSTPKESSSENQQESSSISESTPSQTDTSSQSESLSESESESESESQSESPSESSSPVVEKPEATVYENFIFNYANQNMSVWTIEEINQSVAPDALGNSGEDVSMYKTVGTFGQYGYYTFVIDANGFIEYASYGTGAGWGSPTDGKYHNQGNSWDYTSTDYMVIGADYAAWPAVTDTGANAWNLWDFVIPEGGFVITGWHADPEFEAFWKQLFGEDESPKLANVTTGTNNSFLESHTSPNQLDNFYVSINASKQLEVRERTTDELRDGDGNQEEATFAMNYEPTDEDLVVAYDTLENIHTEFAQDELDKTSTFLVKGVVTAIIDGRTAVIEDENGKTLTIFNALPEDLEVGQTVACEGTLDLYNGLKELKFSSLTVVTGYGSVAMPAPVDVTASNVADVVTVENQGRLVKLVKAQVLEINESGTSKVKLGETELALYKVDFPDEVQVNDYVDVVGTVSVFNTPQIRASVDNISRYYSVVAEINGNTETHGAAKGDTVSLTATAKEGYVFEKWVKVVGDEEQEFEGNTNPSIDVVVEGDAQYKAVYKYSAWSSLPNEYANVANVTLKATNADCGADAVSVITDDTIKLHGDGAWTGGAFNSSWRAIVAVDKDGKIAYAVKNPANGYGGPSGTGYMSVYEDYTTNPAFNILEGYGPWTQADPSASNKFEIVVPEGGFILAAHGTGAVELIKALLGDDVTEWNDANHNKKANDVSKVRAYYDAASGKVKFFRSVATADNVVVGAKVYDSTAETITLGDYTVAVDANGKVMFASRTSDGYGGPGDGFYHDGTYAVEAGKQCGIFNLQPEWAPWPAKATVGGQEVNAWGLYTVVCPEGGYIITGTAEEMLAVVNKVFAKNETALAQPLFETTLVDGTFNETKVNVSKTGDKYVVTAETLINNIEINMDNNEALIITNNDNAITLGDYTIALDENGVVKFASRTTGGYGGPGDGFYHDGTYAVVKGQQCGIFNLQADWDYWKDGSDAHTKYSVVCPEGWTIVTGTADQMLPVVNAAFGREETELGQPLFENTLEDGSNNTNRVTLHKTEYTLKTVKVYDAQIITNNDNAITLGDYTIAFDAKGIVKFASRTSSGYGGPGDGFYHDGTYAAKAGEQCGIFNLQPEWAPWPAKATVGGQEVNAWGLYTVVCPEGWTIVTGSAEDMLPVVNAVFGRNDTKLPDDNSLCENTLVDGKNNTVKVTTEKAEYTLKDVGVKDAQIITSGTELTLGDYTIALDAKGIVKFASRTSSGYGGPADGFYHDGTYAYKAGEVCGIFSLDAEFAPWPATTAGGANAWGLYTVVCPEGWTIITGSAEQMLPVVNAIFGRTETELAQTLFENTLKDGELNGVKSTIKQLEPSNTAVSFEKFADNYNQGSGVYTINTNPQYVKDGTKSLKVTYDGSIWANLSYANWGDGILVADTEANGVKFNIYSENDAKVAFLFGTGGVSGGPAYTSAHASKAYNLKAGWNEVTVCFEDLYAVVSCSGDAKVQAGIVQFGIVMLNETYNYPADAGANSIKGTGTFYVDGMVAVKTTKELNVESSRTAISFETFADDYTNNGVYSITKDEEYVLDGTKALMVSYDGNTWGKTYANWGKGIRVGDANANAITFKIYSSAAVRVSFCVGTGGISGGPSYSGSCYSNGVDLVEGWNEVTLKLSDLYKVQKDASQYPDPTVQAGIVQFGVIVVANTFEGGVDATTVSILNTTTFYVDEVLAVTVE